VSFPFYFVWYDFSCAHRYVALVDIAEPLASSVHFSLQEYAEIAITLTISGVPSSKAEQAEAKAMECLATIKQIDVDRMSSVLNSVLLDELDSFEDETASSIQDDLVSRFLLWNGLLSEIPSRQSRSCTLI